MLNNFSQLNYLVINKKIDFTKVIKLITRT